MTQPANDFMPMPDGYSSESTNRQMCTSFFMDLFSVDELKEKIQQFSPDQIKSHSRKNRRATLYEWLMIDQIQDIQALAEILYDSAGPHFLYEVQGAKPNDIHSNTMRYEVVLKAIAKELFSEQAVLKAINSSPRIKNPISSLAEITKLRVPGPWLDSLYNLFESHLPTEVKEAPSRSEAAKKPIETITAIRELRPLHDYQIFAGKKIRDIIESPREANKRLLISIPTGAGKTRLVAESLIDWINDGKPTEDNKIHNSKYIIWIAQSRELCEQAISQFQEIYTQKGKSALTIFRLFGSHQITIPTILSKKVEHGLIVCTIDKLYKQVEVKEKITDFGKAFLQNSLEYDDKVQKSKIPKKFYEDHYFASLRSMTSCIVVDEAHKAIMPTYTCVLRGLGFNFSHKNEKDINEFGITLVGLTATAFRGTGLEPSREAQVDSESNGKTKIIFKENEIEKSDELNSPLRCSVCKELLSAGDRILQSTSNKKHVWHASEEQLSAETLRIYTRFSKPLVPKIHAFPENKRPKAVITCNEKFVAQDPVRISGEKSYDLLGEIKDFSWKIEKRSRLTEVFGIDELHAAELYALPHLETIVCEVKEPGTYQISLTVENFDGITDTATKTVEVISQSTPDASNDMQELVQNLIKRDILCNVYHTSVKSGRFDIAANKKNIDLVTQMRNQAAENDERNKKLAGIVHYMLSKPRETRKKILVFACDILHARLLQLILRIKYSVNADYVDSDLHESRNIYRIQKFRKEPQDGEGKVLINTNMLTTGFDVPDVDCVIMGRPVLSTVEYTQMIGRGMRGPRMGGTKEVWIVDFDDQVQLHEKKQSTIIRLGWKSMAYDDKHNPIWKPLSEKLDVSGNSLDLEIPVQNEVDGGNQAELEKILLSCHSCKTVSRGVEEISANYDLSPEDRAELEKFCEAGIVPELPSMKCKPCKDASIAWPDSNDPWKFFVLKEKNDPLLLHFVRHIASNFSGSIKVNIADLSDPKKTLKDLLQKVECANNSPEDLYSLNENNLKVFKELRDSALEKISRERLGEFWADNIILQKEIKSKKKLIDLCNHLINPKILEIPIFTNSRKKQDGLPQEQKLRNKTNKIIFEELAYIPEEEEFHKLIGDDLYDFMIGRYATYQNFQTRIGISDYIVKLRARSACLEKIMVYYNARKRVPSFADLGRAVPHFKDVLDTNFKGWEELRNLIDTITQSAWATPDAIKFDELKKDYDFVDDLEPQKPTAESMLRHSKIGIGHYMKYAGTVENFEEISHLPKEGRKQFEQLAAEFKRIKAQMDGVPDEDIMIVHSNYKQVIEFLWFDDYSKFLELMGEDPNYTPKNNSETKTEDKKDTMIKNARAFARSNGMQDLFQRMVKEHPIKYVVNFGSIENFISKVFPENKKVALIRWEDTKRQFGSSLP